MVDASRGYRLRKETLESRALRHGMDGYSLADVLRTTDPLPAVKAC